MEANKYNPNKITLQCALFLDQRADRRWERHRESSFVDSISSSATHDIHPIRPVHSLTRARGAGNLLLHSAHQPEHDVVLLERELLFDLDISYASTQHMKVGTHSLHRAHHRGPEEQHIILRAIEVCSLGIAREGFDALMLCWSAKMSLVVFLMPFKFPRRICLASETKMFKGLTDSFESDPSGQK